MSLLTQSNVRWLPVNNPCCVCGSVDSDLQHTVRYAGLDRPFEMRRCRGCGLLFNSPRIEDLSLLYRGHYYVFAETHLSRYLTAFAQVKRHLDPARGLPPPPQDVLEVGCAKGHLLHILRHLGHRVAGVEISADAAAAARADFGLDNIVTGTIEQYAARHPRPAHDVVWANDVIEHVPDPAAFIAACAAVLRPGGRLILDTPSAGSINITPGDPRWIGFSPFHVFLFDPQSLTRLCENAGLRVSACFTYGNRPTPPPTIRQRLHAAARALTAPIGLWQLARRITYRIAHPDRHVTHPMTPADIDRHLAAIPWHTASPDAHTDIAATLRGDNLVLHATR